MIRSILAVLAGLLALTIVSFAIGVGGYVTAWIARRSQLTLAAIMGAIEVALTLYVMIAGPFHEPHPAPPAIWITGLILMIPAACLGAILRARQEKPHTIR